MRWRHFNATWLFPYLRLHLLNTVTPVSTWRLVSLGRVCHVSVLFRLIGWAQLSSEPINTHQISGFPPVSCCCISLQVKSGAFFKSYKPFDRLVLQNVVTYDWPFLLQCSWDVWSLKKVFAESEAGETRSIRSLMWKIRVLRRKFKDQSFRPIRLQIKFKFSVNKNATKHKLVSTAFQELLGKKEAAN